MRSFLKWCVGCHVDEMRGQVFVYSACTKTTGRSASSWESVGSYTVVERLGVASLVYKLASQWLSCSIGLSKDGRGIRDNVTIKRALSFLLSAYAQPRSFSQQTRWHPRVRASRPLTLTATRIPATESPPPTCGRWWSKCVTAWVRPRTAAGPAAKTPRHQPAKRRENFFTWRRRPVTGKSRLLFAELASWA